MYCQQYCQPISVSDLAVSVFLRHAYHKVGEDGLGLDLSCAGHERQRNGK